MSNSTFTSQLHSISALWSVIISHPAEDRRLSWPGWLGGMLRWCACRKMVNHPVLAAVARNRTRELKTLVLTEKITHWTSACFDHCLNPCPVWARDNPPPAVTHSLPDFPHLLFYVYFSLFPFLTCFIYFLTFPSLRFLPE